jgi:hypothetical protein
VHTFLEKNGLEYILGDFSHTHLVTLLPPKSPLRNIGG